LSEASRYRPSEPIALALRIAPDWEAIRAAWDPCRAMLSRAGFDDDQTYQLAMVAQELLENAVKYGAFHPGERVGLEVRVAPDDVTLEVRSRVGVNDANLRRFDQMVQWIRGFQDPFEGYVERMKTVSAQPYSHGESGLGLTRIAYEGRCVIDFYVDDENMLAVSAVYRPRAEGTWQRR
jgi:hypothetical protein